MIVFFGGAQSVAVRADLLSEQLPYLLAYSIGGMHSMLLKWVENDMTIPSYTLIEQLKNGFNSMKL